MKIFMVFFILSISNLFSQQFPFGAYTATDTIMRIDPDYYNGIKDIGFNTIINRFDNTTESLIKERELKVIALNTDNEFDYVHHYARGYWTIWEAEGDTILENDVVKIRHGSGIKSSFNGISCWKSNTSSDDSLVYGPKYIQDKKYRFIYNEGIVNYEVKIYLAKEIFDKNLNDTACFFYVINNRELRVDGHFIRTIRDTLLSRPIFSSELSANQLNVITTNPYNYINYPANYNSKDILLLPVSGDTTYTDAGTEFIINNLGKYILYIDKIEVYDKMIGEKLINYYSDVVSKIQSYPNILNKNNIVFWYGADEPQSIDCYKPIKTVDSILNNIGAQPLIQAFYPQYDGNAHGGKSIEDFVRITKPKQLMMDLYPGWNDVNWNLGIAYLRVQLEQAALNSPGFYYVPQSFGMTHTYTGDTLTWRRLSVDELNSSVMLALSYGAKGLFFWNYPSYINDTINYYCIVEYDGVTPTNFYDYIQTSLSPRINGNLGEHLLNSSYKNDNLYYRKYDSVNESKLSSTNLEIVNPPVSGYLNIGLLESKKSTAIKYFFPVNQFNNLNGTFTFKAKGFNQYRNNIFRNVEEPLSNGINFYNEYSLNVTIPKGEGYLYQAYPVVIGGGSLTYNDTINVNTTLVNELEIPSNVNLIVSSNYILKSILKVNTTNNLNLKNNGYISLQDNGKVLVNSFGPLAKLKTTDNHPWFIWGKYTGTNIYYKIHRRIAGGTWTQIDTTSNLHYVDNTITIYYENGITVNVEYKVIASKKNDPLSVVSDIISYPMRGGYEKQGNEAAIRYEYNLEQNYPNPFNPQTTINYELKEDGYVSIKIYDILGNLIKDLVNENKTKGKYSTNLNISELNLPSGIYFYSINAGQYINTKKMVILK